MPPSAYEWVARFAEELGTTAPDHAEFNALLGLSSIAAHSSERKAAPVSCWIAARAGVSPADAIAAARRIAGDWPEEASEDRPDGPSDPSVVAPGGA
jgi:hypothetical protein